MDDAQLNEQLRLRYEAGENTVKLAAEFGVSTGTVANRLKAQGVKLRGRHYGRWSEKVCEVCGKSYVPSGPAARFCSDACRLGTAECESCGGTFVKRPTQGDKAANDNRYCSYQCRWNSVRSRDEYGRYLNSEGYIVLNKNYSRKPPTHDVNGQGYARVNFHGRVGRVLEHRHVMEQHLGRPLLPDESVHHKNGIKTDNRLENLELWVGKHPRGQRVEDQVEWAMEILQRYAPERLIT